MQTTNDYLGKEPIGKLILKFSVPCIISLLISALYNIVDQIFIGRGLGYLANGATNVVFPITIVALAIALLIGDGAAAYLSLCQGKKDEEGAHKCVGNAVVLIVLCSVILTVFFAIFRDNILWGVGATENNIAYATEYFAYIIIGIPFFIFGNAMNSIIRADGSPKFAMISTFVGCILNVILDPIAIFMLGWGMKGAALATITGQIVSAVLAAYYLFHSKSFRLTKSSYKLKAKRCFRFLSLGISSFLTQVSIVIIMCVMNNVLVKYGAQSVYGADIPLTVVGIVMKVFQIVISIIVGVAAGAQPIIGYNYGAEKFERVKDIFKLVMKIEFIVGIVAMICFEVFPMQIINIFGSEEGLYNEFAVMTFRIYLSTIVLCCMQKAISIFLQALGKPIFAMGISLLRDFVLSVPLILILSAHFGVTGVLYTAPIADIISIVVAFVCMAHIFRKDFGKKEAELTPKKA